MLTENEEAWVVQMLSLLITEILAFVADRVDGDFGVFVRVEAVVMFLNFMCYFVFYVWRNWPRS